MKFFIILFSLFVTSTSLYAFEVKWGISSQPPLSVTEIFQRADNTFSAYRLFGVAEGFVSPALCELAVSPKSGSLVLFYTLGFNELVPQGIGEQGTPIVDYKESMTGNVQNISFKIILSEKQDALNVKVELKSRVSDGWRKLLRAQIRFYHLDHLRSEAYPLTCNFKKVVESDGGRRSILD